ncbi:MAG: hypothetical protein FWB96_05020 [Defluviitaleaceae bacterium]|nr:hypothetical protein [Defluviitaleaceae bacterium]MCL2262205.1 hypothetical protein [Defluviitaleaceae bacterium]
MKKSEKTPYETNPVEGPVDAICAFVEGYDVLQKILNETGEEHEIADALRAAMYRPVRPEGGDNPPISLYEIGVVFVPSADGPGKYGINERKLEAALKVREYDIRALFVQEDGILPHLAETLSDFLQDEELDEFIYAAMLRFLNECRRLTAMWT